MDRLELALQASNEGIWDWQIGAEEIFYSPKILAFLDWDPAQAPNFFADVETYIHRSDLSNFLRAYELAITKGDIFAVESRLRHQDGSWVWLRIRATVVRNHFNEAVRLVGSMIDISKRKSAEESLETERNLLRMVIDHVPLSVFFKDRESRFFLVNERLVNWLGAPSLDDVLGKTDADFFGGVHAKQAFKDELEIIRTGEAMVDRLEKETWEGRADTWAQTTKMPWRNHQGKVVGTFGISSNVTELVKTQQELRRRNEMIEEELQLAKEIQQALLPSALPSFPVNTEDRDQSLSFSHRYRPSTGMAGDFFELIPISETKIGMLVADVMGHGVRSALVVSMIRGLLEKEKQHAADPATFLSSLNDSLASILQRAGTTMFATVSYMVVDVEAQSMVISSAGHPLPVARYSDRTELLKLDPQSMGPAIGLFPGAPYGNTELGLSDLECILLYTDGIIECEDENGEAFETERLAQVVRNHSGATLDLMLDDAMQAVLNFAHTDHFDDDVCMLAVQFGTIKSPVNPFLATADAQLHKTKPLKMIPPQTEPLEGSSSDEDSDSGPRLIFPS